MSILSFCCILIMRFCCLDWDHYIESDMVENHSSFLDSFFLFVQDDCSAVVDTCLEIADILACYCCCSLTL